MAGLPAPPGSDWFSEPTSLGPPVSLRIGHTGFGIGIGLGVGIGVGAPVDIRALPVLGPGLAAGMSQAGAMFAVRAPPRRVHSCCRVMRQLTHVFLFAPLALCGPRPLRPPQPQ